MTQPVQRPLTAQLDRPALAATAHPDPPLPTLVYRLLSSVLTRAAHTAAPLEKEQAEPSLLPTLGALDQRGFGVTPEELRPWARHAYRHTAANNLQRFAALEPLAIGLEDARIPWAGIKGLDSLIRLYPDVGWRAMSDFDILVRPADLELVDALMTRSGFEQHEPRTTVMQPARVYRSDHLFVDVHVRLGRAAVPLPAADRLLTCTMLVEVEGCPIRTLSRSDAYLSLALLMAKDTFSPRHLDALRLAELALLGDRLRDNERRDLVVEAGRKHWLLALRRAGELEDWVRGGAKPRWADSGLGRTGTRDSSPLSRWQVWARTAALRDSTVDALKYLTAELGASFVRTLSGRRLGSL